MKRTACVYLSWGEGALRACVRARARVCVCVCVRVCVRVCTEGAGTWSWLYMVVVPILAKFQLPRTYLYKCKASCFATASHVYNKANKCV